MAKVKVGALAKELKLTAKELIKMLKDLGVVVKTAASSIDQESAQVVREIANPSKPKEQKPSKEETTPVPPAEQEIIEEEPPSGPQIESEDISVKELADLTRIKPSDLIKELMKRGALVNINQRIKAETAKEIAGVLGEQVMIKLPKKKDKQILDAKIKALSQSPTSSSSSHRPPIVTIMGHVDHGKTKLLDAIRKTRVAEGEAGGITQHIGAYQVEVHGKKVTFLDTPGHEAFTALRARGAKVTDVAVLVVAADDGVKPQTVEAIDHAKAAGVPIIVAINKIDRPQADLDRVKQQLSKLDLAPEDWGGKTVMVPTSATQNQGITELLEMILLVAEMAELKADPEAVPAGVVIESRIDKGRGPVATVLVKSGTLKVGDIFNIGDTSGKVRALFNDRGERLTSAGSSTPVEVLGSVNVPKAGDILQVVSSEKEARLLAEQKKERGGSALRGNMLSLEDFSKHIKEGETKNLTLVLKADVQGSNDAVVHSLQDLKIGNIGVNIIHKAVGPVNESDIMLAKASGAIVVGFTVGLDGNTEAVAEREGVEVRKYNIIYKLIDDIKLAMEGLLEPEYEEVILGHAEVRSLFKFSKVGVIAGCFVKDGKLVRGKGLRIFRGDEKIYEGKMVSLKRFKDDVKMVEQNFECGVAVPGYSDFKAGDIVENFEIREKARKR